MGGLFKRFQDIISGLAGADRFERVDFVILKTLLTLAAVDGEVGADEVARFKNIAIKCRGNTGEGFVKLWDAAVRSAGYLLLQSKFLTQDELVELFVKESENDFVDEIAREASEERDRAFNFLEQIAQSDGDYSEVERRCIDALEKRVDDLRAMILDEHYPRAAKFDRK